MDITVSVLSGLNRTWLCFSFPPFPVNLSFSLFFLHLLPALASAIENPLNKQIDISPPAASPNWGLTGHHLTEWNALTEEYLTQPPFKNLNCPLNFPEKFHCDWFHTWTVNVVCCCGAGGWGSVRRMKKKRKRSGSWTSPSGWRRRSWSHWRSLSWSPSCCWSWNWT